jgi:hypothetical protein
VNQTEVVSGADVIEIERAGAERIALAVRLADGRTAKVTLGFQELLRALRLLPRYVLRALHRWAAEDDANEAFVLPVRAFAATTAADPDEILLTVYTPDGQFHFRATSEQVVMLMPNLFR